MFQISIVETTHLKAALCVTIYPPCNGSGVPRLRLEECESLLNLSMPDRDLTEL